MVSDHVLSQRRRALEDEFFTRQDNLLLQRMRAAGEAQTRREALAAASGITDDALLDRLVALGLGPETLTALAIVPMVLVAWADGSVEKTEREAILAGARETGLDQQHDSRELLDRWLSAKPGPELADAWFSYAKAVSASLAPDAKAGLRQEIIGRCRRVAEAAGGFLLSSRISPAEKAVLAKLDQAFDA
jgi:tellurite resistance protein